MHELAVTESILSIVLRHARLNGVCRVMTVHLRIGRLSDLETPWIQRYFDRLSVGTVADGARISVESIPVRLACAACGTVFEAEIRVRGSIPCPSCTETRVRLVSGHDYRVESIEAV